MLPVWPLHWHACTCREADVGVDKHGNIRGELDSISMQETPRIFSGTQILVYTVVSFSIWALGEGSGGKGGVPTEGWRVSLVEGAEGGGARGAGAAGGCVGALWWEGEGGAGKRRSALGGLQHATNCTIRDYV